MDSARRDRFSEQHKTLIQISAERFLTVAYKMGDPLGMWAPKFEAMSDITG